jgi:hypothetical protein
MKKDLELQQYALRSLQDDVSKLEELEKTMVSLAYIRVRNESIANITVQNQGRFIVVLIDADADIYVVC